MDRAEKIGFGTALGGHALLLGAFAIGLLISNERIVKPQPISVSLVGEVSDVSTAPDPVQEEPAPAESAPAPTPAEPEPTPVMQVEQPPVKPLPKLADKPLPKPVKQQAKPLPKQASATPVKPKQQTKPSKPTSQSNPKPFSKSFEDAVKGTGSNPKPTAGTSPKQGTVARKAGAEVRREVNLALGPQIRDRIERCAPTGLDIRQIETFVTLNLEPNGRLVDVRIDRQTGINDNNKPQAEPLKRCIIQAVRSASPFKGLDPDYHDVWKTHAMRLRATG